MTTKSPARPAPPRGRTADEGPLDDLRAVRIPWRKVAIAAIALVAVVAACFLTTNTYAVLWQQRLHGAWDARIAAGTIPPGAPAGGEAVARVAVPALGLDLVVLEGNDLATLRKAPGHQPGTALPGELGVSIVRGHRLLWSGPFGRLGELNFGSPILVQARDGSTYRYLVSGVYRIDADNLDALAAPAGQNTLTLVTSDPPFRADRLLVVKAVLPETAQPIEAAENAESA